MTSCHKHTTLPKCHQPLLKIQQRPALKIPPLKSNSFAPENGSSQKERIVFQASFFRGKLSGEYPSNPQNYMQPPSLHGKFRELPSFGNLPHLRKDLGALGETPCPP